VVSFSDSVSSSDSVYLIDRLTDLKRTVVSIRIFKCNNENCALCSCLLYMCKGKGKQATKAREGGSRDVALLFL
jgi:hypothetical protein